MAILMRDGAADPPRRTAAAAVDDDDGLASAGTGADADTATERRSRTGMWVRLRQQQPAVADSVAFLARYWRLQPSEVTAIALAAVWQAQRAVIEAALAEAARAQLDRRHVRAYRVALDQARLELSRALDACAGSAGRDADMLLARIRRVCPPPGRHDWPTLAWERAWHDLEQVVRARYPAAAAADPDAAPHDVTPTASALARRADAADAAASAGGADAAAADLDVMTTSPAHGLVRR